MSSPTTFDKYTTQTSNGFSSYQPCEKRSFQLLSNTGQNILVQKFNKEFMNKEKKIAKKSPTERHSMTIKQTKLVTLSIATSQFLAFFTLLRATS